MGAATNAVPRCSWLSLLARPRRASPRTVRCETVGGVAGRSSLTGANLDCALAFACFKRAGWRYLLAVAFIVLYLGEHYVIDLAAALALAEAVRRIDPLLQTLARGNDPFRVV